MGSMPIVRNGAFVIAQSTNETKATKCLVNHLVNLVSSYGKSQSLGQCPPPHLSDRLWGVGIPILSHWIGRLRLLISLNKQYDLHLIIYLMVGRLPNSS